MARVEKITIAVTPEQAESLRAGVASGDFASISEAARAAIREWRDRRELLGWDVDDLRKMADEGEASGFSPWTGVEEIIAKGKKILEARKAG